MINGANLPEDILNLNVYAPKHGMSKYSIQKLGKLQGEIDESIVKLWNVIPFASWLSV